MNEEEENEEGRVECVLQFDIYVLVTYQPRLGKKLLIFLKIFFAM